jgi:hypothetical protein
MATIPLTQSNPELCREWHPTLNGDLTPDSVARKGIKVWWLGKCGHYWDSEISLRIRGYGCPYCSGNRVLKGFNDLATKYPNLAQEWHPTLNEDLTPSEVIGGGHIKYWWLGKCGHSWKAEISSRANGRGCGYCSGNKVLKGFNDLKSQFPKIAKEWHPTLNGDLKPSEVIAGTADKAFWLGVCGHTWEASIGSRTKANKGCGYCSGNFVLKGFNDLETKFSNLAQEWHPTLNGDLTPSEVIGGGHIKYWWLGKCGHHWESSISNRLRHSCPYCGGNLVLKGFNDLETIYPELCREWHPTKNLPLEPSQINSGTNKPYWWLGKCGHEWEASVGNRVRGAGCSICAGKEVLAGFNDLASRYPELLEEWDYAKNTHLDPTKLISGSREPAWWLGKCGHKWNSQITNRSISGAGCPKCSPGGFSSSHPGFIYFIHNPQLMAFKVGISNPTAINNRLTMFSRQGWSVIKTWDSESGLTILSVETKFFRWLRKDKKIPRYLSKNDMGLAQGHSETFSDSILTRQEVIAKIEELLAQVLENPQN